MINLTTPVGQLTLGELLDAIDLRNRSILPPLTQANATKVDSKVYVYGLAGLAKLVGCSKNHAWKLKKNGVFDGAIIQNDRLIIIDKEKALELFEKRNY